MFHRSERRVPSTRGKGVSYDVYLPHIKNMTTPQHSKRWTVGLLSVSFGRAVTYERKTRWD